MLIYFFIFWWEYSETRRSRCLIWCIFQQEFERQTALLERLRARVGRTVGFEIEDFENWAGNQTSRVLSCYPQTKEEMSIIIKFAAEENMGIRCAGSRHSWAPVFADSFQICVNTENMKSDYTSRTNIRIADVSIYYGIIRLMTIFLDFVVDLINEIRRLKNCNIQHNIVSIK